MCCFFYRINLKLTSVFFLFNNVEWILYEQVAIAAMDTQCLDVAKVKKISFTLLLKFLRLAILYK